MRGRMKTESDTCLVVVTVFKIVAPALRAGGWVRFPPSPPPAVADAPSVAVRVGIGQTASRLRREAGQGDSMMKASRPRFEASQRDS